MTTINDVLKAAAPEQVTNALTRDYSLLRPFDLEAAKRGEPIMQEDASEFIATLAAISKDGRTVFAEFRDGSANAWAAYAVRMAPLCWVEGRPVYKGNVLYRLDTGAEGSATAAFGMGVVFSEWPARAFAANEITWTPPKVKREVKLLAYIGVHGQLFWRKETATPQFPATRVPTEDRIVVVEEPTSSQ